MRETRLYREENSERGDRRVRERSERVKKAKRVSE